MKQSPDSLRRLYASWRAANPEAWEFIEREAVAAMEAGRKFSIRPFVERLRWQDRANAEGNRVGVPNVIVPCFVRQLMEDYPDMVPLITRRHSKIDRGVEVAGDGE